MQFPKIVLLSFAILPCLAVFGAGGNDAVAASESAGAALSPAQGKTAPKGKTAPQGCGDIKVNVPAFSVPALTHQMFGDRELGGSVVLRVTTQLWTTPMRVHLTGKVEMVGDGDFTSLEQQFHKVIYDARSNKGCRVTHIRSSNVSTPHQNPSHGYLYDTSGQGASSQKKYTGTMKDGKAVRGGIIESVTCKLNASGDDLGKVGCSAIKLAPVEVRLSSLGSSCSSFEVGQGHWRLLHPVLHRKGHGDAQMSGTVGKTQRKRVLVNRNPLVGTVNYAPEDRIGPEVETTDDTVTIVGNINIQERGNDLSEFEQQFSIPLIDPNDMLPHCAVTSADFADAKRRGPSEHDFVPQGGVAGQMYNNSWNQAFPKMGAVRSLNCRVDTPGKDGIGSGGLGCGILFDAVSVNVKKRSKPKILAASLAFRAQGASQSLNPLGGACTKNGQCQSGACDHGNFTGGTDRCVPSKNTGIVGNYCSQHVQCANNNCTANKCAAPKDIGGSCTTHAGCKPGLACDGNHKCTAGPNAAKNGQYCSNTNQCSTNSFCPSSNSKCQARKGVGASCAAGGDRCKPGMGCDGNHKCTAGPNAAKNGEYCSNTNQCSTNSFCPSTNSKCQARAGIGGSCAAGGDQCAPGLGCDGNHKCTAGPNAAKDGQYCSNTNQCSTNSFCPSSNSKCKKRADIGDSCSSNGDCRPGQACDNQKKRCTAGPNAAKNGQYCTNTNQCSKSSFCTYAGGKCKGKLNVPKNKFGDNATYKCTSNSQCKSNYCDHPRNSRCYPSQNAGAPGYFCVQHANCYSGHQCQLEPGKSWGYCN